MKNVTYLQKEKFYFRTIVARNGFLCHQICHLSPKKFERLFQHWIYEIRSSKSSRDLIDEIVKLKTERSENDKILTYNETHLHIHKETITFDAKYITGLKPITIPIEDALCLFEKYCDWLERYENCEIPGLIPESRLDSWSCVPNEYIKEEYWQKKKKDEMNK